MDNSEILNAIPKSGFPFEVECCEKLRSLGFNIDPSLKFFDYFRNKNSELDIRATKTKSFFTHENFEISCTLTIAIECKKNSDPLLVFNILHNSETNDEWLDRDSFFCHINTSRDKAPNYFTFPLFDSKSTSLDVKQNHHQFINEGRCFNLTQFEKKIDKNGNNISKVHTTDTLKYVTEKLGAYAYNFNHTWFDTIKRSKFNLEQTLHSPAINILFLILIHNGEQFKVNGPHNSLSQERILTVFGNHVSVDQNVPFIVDIVSYENLEFAIKKIETTYNYMMNHLLKWFLVQK